MEISYDDTCDDISPLYTDNLRQCYDCLEYVVPAEYLLLPDGTLAPLCYECVCERHRKQENQV